MTVCLYSDRFCTFFGMALFGESFDPILVFVLPPGAFIGLGFLVLNRTTNALQASINEELSQRAKSQAIPVRRYPSVEWVASPPGHLD